MKKVLIIGGGAAGMMAAVKAAEGGCQVHLYEKNEKLGKKIYITGKGRCNFTNACDMEKLLESVCTNRKFLYSAFYGFTNQDAIHFFEKNGMKTKIERGERAFPLSDKSADVIDTLRDAMKRAGVKVHLNEEVEEILTEAADLPSEDLRENQKKKPLIRDRKVTGILLKNGKKIEGDFVLVATGGLSYKTTGSTGDGYKFAEKCGHTVTECFPSLVPFNTKEENGRQMQGLSLRNIELSVYDGKKMPLPGFWRDDVYSFWSNGAINFNGQYSGPEKAQTERIKTFY